jgi:hypothetical protein
MTEKGSWYPDSWAKGPPNADEVVKAEDIFWTNLGWTPVAAVIYDHNAKPKRWWQFWRKRPFVEVIDLRGPE